MLKRTGIVRRIDDVGRVLFPKALRDQLNIGDGQKYLYVAPYKPSRDAFEEFANIAIPLLRYGGMLAVFSANKVLQEIRQNGLTEAQCWQLAAALRETVHKPTFSADCEVLNLGDSWPLHVVICRFVCNGTFAGYIMLGQASKDATCLPGLQAESRYMATLAGQIFEKAGWM